MTRTRLALLTSLVVLAACQRPAEPAEPASSAPAAPAAVPAPEPDAAAAFRAAWGAAAPATWRAPEAGPDAEARRFTQGRLIPLGGDRFALVSEGQGGDGHVSAGALAIHYLTRTAAGFTRAAGAPLIIEGGTFGAPPQWSLRTDLTPSPAVVTEAGGTWQGYSCSWSDVVELTPQGPVLRADAIPVGYSSGGADPDKPQEVEGALTADVKGRSFAVRYSGDRTATVRYALAGDRYAPTTTPDLPSC